MTIITIDLDIIFRFNIHEVSMIELAGLELAKYILLRLVVNNESIERLADDFGYDVRFINGVVKL